MRKINLIGVVFFLTVFTGCKSAESDHDATGTFEADEVIVSSELSGKLISFKIQEGMLMQKDSIAAIVDARNILLQQDQVEASIRSLHEKTSDVAPQVKLLQNQLEVQQSQLNNLQHEKARIENLVKADAATVKQQDDINAQIDVAKKQISVTQQQINVQRSMVSTQNRGILSEANPLKKRVAQLQDQAQRANITNPVTGTVISKYAEEGEITATGKALYKIADLSVLNLRAYITGGQLSRVKLGQSVKVLIDEGAKKYKEYDGIIKWVSDKAEFTPKTIQTKEERSNLVYAIKIGVKNDGYLKIGMYGEVKF